MGTCGGDAAPRRGGTTILNRPPARSRPGHYHRFAKGRDAAAEARLVAAAPVGSDLDRAVPSAENDARADVVAARAVLRVVALALHQRHDSAVVHAEGAANTDALAHEVRGGGGDVGPRARRLARLAVGPGRRAHRAAA